MFNDSYGLTKAVLEGRKTMTRRIVNFDRVPTLIPGRIAECCLKYAHYKVGEVVAVAQSYKDVYSDKDFGEKGQIDWEYINSFDMRNTAGFTNKMFVQADLMPHQIRITNVRVERLQDISDEDCMCEGIRKMTFDTFSFDSWKFFARSPREAFAALIDKVSGKGVWNRNPWVFVYEFELVK